MSDILYDPLQREFEIIYEEFVAAGGLDTTQVINERFEIMRRSYLCTHGRPTKECAYCYRPLPPYQP